MYSSKFSLSEPGVFGDKLIRFRSLALLAKACDDETTDDFRPDVLDPLADEIRKCRPSDGNVVQVTKRYHHSIL